METIFLERIYLVGIHKRYNLDINFNKSLNILYGHNGSGKTTLIHIIANILNGDFLRFSFLDFNSIKAYYSNENWVEITQNHIESGSIIKVCVQNGNCIEFNRTEAKEALRNERRSLMHYEHQSNLIKSLNIFLKENDFLKLGTSYFPAFRTMLEAWSLNSDAKETAPLYAHRRLKYATQVTNFSREIFGNFLPKINFPSPIDIEQNLREEIRNVQIQIGRYESAVFSESFVKVFSALLSGGEGSQQDAHKLLREISELTPPAVPEKSEEHQVNDTYRQLQRLMGGSQTSRELAGSAVGALTVYRDALQERKDFQIKAFEQIHKYFAAVNAFLENKKLAYEAGVVRRFRTKVGLEYPDGTWSSVRVMSSGERQLLTILYAATKMSEANTVLIDEPELSLHIDWQEDLLGKMMEQFGNRQIIVCTHSPAISSAYDEYMTEIVPQLLETTIPSSLEDEDEDEEL